MQQIFQEEELRRVRIEWLIRKYLSGISTREEERILLDYALKAYNEIYTLMRENKVAMVQYG